MLLRVLERDLKMVRNRRNETKKTIMRKRKICKILGYPDYEWNRYNKLHIGCGCGLCKPYKGYRHSSKQEREEYFSSLDMKEYFREVRNGTIIYGWN